MTTAEMLQKPQTITTPNGDEMVVIPKALFEELRRLYAEAEEDAVDIAIYDARKSDVAGSMPMPAEVSMALLKGERRIRAIRQWKRLTQQELAAAAGVAQGHLSDMETGRRAVTGETAKAIADALGVSIDWLED